MNCRKLCRTLRCAALCLLAVLLFCGAASAREPALAVYFFDAGKADAILLTTENSAVLIDAGGKGFGKEILSYCAENGIEKLDYLIVTHFDKDHVGGAARVINQLPVGQVLQSNCPQNSDECENYREALRKAGLEPVTVREELRFTLDDVIFTVDPPRLEIYAKDPSNNSSLIVSVSCGVCRLLFTGDAENARLSEWLAGNPGEYDLVKMPHHGNWQRTLEPLLEETHPSLAVITSSLEKPESAKTLELLECLSVRTLLTREGPVLLRCDGNSLVPVPVEAP